MRLLVPPSTLNRVSSFGSSHLHSYLRRYQSSKESKESKPLRILFCGSDEFSCESLRALNAQRKLNSNLIASIDVLCRPGKRSGRYLKNIRDVPIKAVAHQLGLRIHERDTFTNWELPETREGPINLIIAVSFGLFVPPRILRSVEYGGLNVHPSLLPNFRGPAPLQHTIMAQEERTGVTLQTLDENSFDHGIILAQTRPPGLPIPSPQTCTYDDLLEFIKPKAAALLTRGLAERVFVPPLVDVGEYSAENIRHAPKVTTQDTYIQWEEWDAETMFARYRALGRLWTRVSSPDRRSGVSKRIIFEDFELIDRPTSPADEQGIWKETVFASKVHWREDPESENEGTILLGSNLETSSKVLRVRHIITEGQTKKDAAKVMIELGSKQGITPRWRGAGSRSIDILHNQG